MSPTATTAAVTVMPTPAVVAVVAIAKKVRNRKRRRRNKARRLKNRNRKRFAGMYFCRLIPKERERERWAVAAPRTMPTMENHATSPRRIAKSTRKIMMAAREAEVVGNRHLRPSLEAWVWVMEGEPWHYRNLRRRTTLLAKMELRISNHPRLRKIQQGAVCTTKPRWKNSKWNKRLDLVLEFRQVARNPWRWMLMEMRGEVFPNFTVLPP
mmetsp:Transcript_17835/g.34609  ORF Transcript_17835/g.34609 Transcript_17835/m.34609 type:complete len:211 (-) Transcript_17835:343-975(-)